MNFKFVGVYCLLDIEILEVNCASSALLKVDKLALKVHFGGYCASKNCPARLVDCGKL